MCQSRGQFGDTAQMGKSAERLSVSSADVEEGLLPPEIPVMNETISIEQVADCLRVIADEMDRKYMKNLPLVDQRHTCGDRQREASANQVDKTACLGGFLLRQLFRECEETVTARCCRTVANVMLREGVTQLFFGYNVFRWNAARLQNSTKFMVSLSLLEYNYDELIASWALLNRYCSNSLLFHWLIFDHLSEQLIEHLTDDQ